MCFILPACVTQQRDDAITYMLSNFDFEHKFLNLQQQIQMQQRN